MLSERLDMLIVQYNFSRLRGSSCELLSEVGLNRELKRQNHIILYIINQIVQYAVIRKEVLIFTATIE